MKKKKIKYIGFYDTISNQFENRNSVLSATNKMDYIIDVLNNEKYDVEIISPSWTTNKTYYKSKTINIKPGKKLKLFSTLPWNSKLVKGISIIYSFFQLCVYLLTHLKIDEQIIVYHSKWLSLSILFIKKLKPNITLVLEVEEIYNDVNSSWFWGKIEQKVIMQSDKYIFSTELLNERLNKRNKPYTVIYGAYTNVGKKHKNKFDDNKIHIVYAGTFNVKKGGAVTAIKAGEFLSKNYHLHIIGFGNTAEKLIIKQEIQKVVILSEAKITYDGLYMNEDYNMFLQKCNIGLSTQIPGDIFNKTSFPSKILSYMSNGLRVVSVKLEVTEKSEITNHLYYYNKTNPEDIANTIMSVDLSSEYNSRLLIKNLHEDFTKKIRSLLDERNTK